MARELAFNNAKDKAAQLAAAADVTLGPVLSIEEGDGYGGGPSPVLRMQAMADMAPPIESGEVGHSVSLQVVFSLLDEPSV